VITRRAIALAAAAMPLCARAAPGPAKEIDRAMELMGGRKVLEKVRVLRWTGAAKIYGGPQVIEIGVSTVVRPFRGAQSDSWLLSEGPAKTRSLIIDGDRGWTVRDGIRAPMPPAMLAHERAQYALYGLMLLAPLKESGAIALASPGDERRVLVSHPGAPSTLFDFYDDDRLGSAHNAVPSPDEGGKPIAQDITFEGEITGGGVRWPRKLTIRQSGQLYFELTLATFEAGPA
jgi:hypothetical protein